MTVRARRAVVTGIGVETPAGSGVDELWNGVAGGRSFAAPISSFDATDFPVRFACEAKGFDPSRLVSRREARRLDRSTQLGLVAALTAVEDAGELGADPARTAVVSGTGIGGFLSAKTHFLAMIQKGHELTNPFMVPMVMPNAAAAMISMRLGYQGPSLCIATACASGANAVGEGMRLLREGRADVVVAGGSEALIMPDTLAGFWRIGALSTRNHEPLRASRPFDRDRDGFVVGEGAGFVVLELLDRAQARGARIYGEVLGYGANSDAHHIIAPSPAGIGAAACMDLALADAGAQPADIGHINAHGTATEMNDAIEAEAIAKIFGTSPPPVTSSKGSLGHLVGAAGAVEMVVALLSAVRGVVPPTANHERLDENINLDVVARRPRRIAPALGLSNSFGFGGHNASLVVGPVG